MIVKKNRGRGQGWSHPLVFFLASKASLAPDDKAKREAAEAACLGRLGLKSENLGTTRKFPPIFFLGVSWPTSRLFF